MAKTDSKTIITVAMKTDRGRLREQNEDACRINARVGLAIVADGLGGHAGGERASRLAVDTLAALVHERLEPGVDAQSIESVLVRAFEQAAQHIRKVAATDYHLKDMGTTVVLALCGDECVYIAHLGDSRAYLLRNHVLTQLTQDHSMVEELVRTGQLSFDESKVHPMRNVVMRSLGPTDDATPSIQAVEWSTDDTLLLCTDGLTNMLSHEEIEIALRQTPANVQDMCARLVNAANDRGGHDNITVVMAQHI